MLYRFSLEAIALQKEGFLQVLNKALLFKHINSNECARNIFSEALGSPKHAGQLYHAGQCREYHSEEEPACRGR